MEPNLDQERRQAHALLDALPAKKLNAVRSLLEVMAEPLARSLAPARIRPEAVSEDTAPERIAVNWSPEARADLRAIDR